MKKLSKILSRRLGPRPADADADDDRPSTRDSSPDYHQLTLRQGPLRKRSFPRTGSSRIVADTPGLEGEDDDDDDEPPLPPLPHEADLAQMADKAFKTVKAEKTDSPDRVEKSLPVPCASTASTSRPSTSQGPRHKHGRKGPKQRPCATCRGTDFPKLLDWRPGNPRPWVSLSHALVADEASAACPFCSFFQAMVGAAAPDGTGKFAPYLRIRLAFERLNVGERHELGRAVLIEVTTRDKTLPWGYIVKAAVEEEGNIEPETDGEERRVNVAGYLGKDPLIRGRTVPPLLDPTLPRTWIAFCKENHEDQPCSRVQPLVQNLRLVDCETKSVVPAEDVEGEGLEYVTLSYVRGSAGSDPSADRDSDLSDRLPPLIADAIAFTKSLGFRYLWIDRYCMPSLEKTERRRHLDLMGEIYARSALTLVIAAGESALDGIPGVSVPREEQLSLKTQTGLFTTSLLRPDLEVGSSKWAQRAWTFQEGLFARRRLVFTPSQIYFQCQTLHCHESISLPLHLAPSINLGRVFPDLSTAASQPGHIRNQIRAFIPKELTSHADRLDAFRGVLRRYANMENAVENLFGLPLFHHDDFRSAKVVSQTDRLAVGLGWMPDRTVSGQGHTAPYSYVGGFPSWTWLAWRPREGTALNNMFHFNLVEETSPAIQGVAAAPGMEISVGFDDQTVLSWEIDGDAIAKKADRIAFLRVETFCFDMRVHKADDAVALVDFSLGSGARDSVEAWFRSSSTPTSTPEGESAVPLPDGEYDLTGVLISGRNWHGAAVGERVATVLILARQGYKRDGKLVRLGALSVVYEGFTPAPVDGDGPAVMRGVDNDADEKKKDLEVRLRELDIY